MLRQNGRRRLVSVQARWYGLPIGWMMVHAIDVDQQRVTLRHESPLTRGSIAIWDVRPAAVAEGQPAAVDLIVSQRVTVPLPGIGGLLARRLVGGRVWHGFGLAMLDRIKAIAEHGSLDDPS